jgi:hypothetical protein
MDERENLDTETKASLERALEQSAAGDVEPWDFNKTLEDSLFDDDYCDGCGQHYLDCDCDGELLVWVDEWEGF